ncbi:Crp/Fnr family transcriptional regulator [Phenylobacterium sp.]|uniref:Crp/Fnr family transcriptional regulator n=1 Tax=Phenylobacterium sp. TaxID=1871053 RepID=UPI002734D34E|nr:Crp/Fnr family transcriptional regulator [Phenylobacterium sp.]MDP3852750.1 Crp/Fnr family transcriptional regulator [Phenylobacterium sp.]
MTIDAANPPSDLKPTHKRSANRLLAAVRRGDYDLIERHLLPVELARGQVLFEPGDDVVTTHFPGPRTMVSLLIVTRDGREVEAATIGREGAIGGIVSAGNKPAYGRAVVTIPGPALAIPTATLETLKAASPAFSDLFSRYADALLAQLMQSVACNALHSVEARASRWLLATHDRAGEAIIHLTQESLAEMLGVQRTTVTGVVQSLEERGLIRRHRGRVEVVDRRGLERHACECYAAVEDHFALLLPEVDL